MTALQAALWPLDSLKDPALSAVGGKAYGLWRLVSAGLPVPRAFVIPAQLHADALACALPDAPDLDALRAALARAPLPPALLTQLAAIMAADPHKRWALRSSAVDEDGAAHSFAGQQHTSLHIDSPDQAAQAIRDIWCAALDARALLYRVEAGAEELPAPVAILLQEMIAPDVAGVLFTRDPVRPDAPELVINAALGLGKQVVDGDASHTLYLERPSGYLRRHQPPADQPDAPNPLDAHMLGQLVRMAGRVEECFGPAQDVEWAWDARGLWLLQLRPMTALRSPAPERAVWSNVNVGEALPGVGTPLTWSIIRSFSRMGFVRAFGSLGLDVPEDFGLVGAFQGRVYLNLTQFMTIASAIPLLQPDTLFTLAGGGGADVVKDTFTPRSPLRFLSRLPITIPRVALEQLATPLVAPAWHTHFIRQRDDLFAQDLTRLSHEALGKRLTGLERLFERNGLITLTVSANFLMSFVVMRELLRLFDSQTGAPLEQTLLGALRVRSAEPGLDLLRLGHIARRSLRLRRLILDAPRGHALDALRAEAHHPDVATFLDDLNRFCEVHGHRAPREAELATPRWREDTTFLFDVLRAHIEAPALPTPQEIHAERDRALAAARARLRKLIPAPLLPTASALVAWSRYQARWRELLRAQVIDSLDMLRRFALECGRRMVTSGHLNKREDVFFLRQDELRAWLDDPAAAGAELRYKVMIRTEVHAHLSASPDPPPTFIKQGARITPIHPAQPLEGGSVMTDGHQGVVHGLPGGAGRVTGRARVLLDPADAASLQPGEVLVVPHADVGWTPLFLSASAVVMGLGGPLSHACIVAREFGLPAVVNATRAVEHIQTGALVTVDGEQGFVIVHDQRV